MRFKQLNNHKTLVVGSARAARVSTRVAPAGAQLVAVHSGAVGVGVVQPVAAVDVVRYVVDAVVAAVGAGVRVGMGVAARPVGRAVLVCSVRCACVYVYS